MFRPKLNPLNPWPTPPAGTQQPHRPLVELDLPVGEVRHLLEGVDGDEHRPNVGLSGRLRSLRPFPCPFPLPLPAWEAASVRAMAGRWLRGVPASSWKLHQEYHKGLQLGCRQSCRHDLVLSWPRGPSALPPQPQGVPCSVNGAGYSRSIASAPWPLAEDRLQKWHFQRPRNSPSAQLLMLHLRLLQQDTVSILQPGKLRHGEERNHQLLPFPSHPATPPPSAPACSIPESPKGGQGNGKVGNCTWK